MRRSRWDQAPENEEPIASGSRWNGQCRPAAINWEHQSRVDASVTSEREHLSTPRPLDYSSDSRKRSQSSSINGTNKDKSETHRKNSGNSLGNQSSVHAPQWPPYTSPLQPLYPTLGQNGLLPHPTHNQWNQLQGFYNDNYQDNSVFDLKWFGHQRQIIESHLRINEHNSESTSSKDHHHKVDPSRLGICSLGGRPYSKHNERGYEGRKYNRFSSNTNYERNKSFRDHRSYSNNSSNLSNNRYGKFDSNAYKFDRRSFFSDRDSQHHRSIWRHSNNYNNNNRDYSSHSRVQDFPDSYRSSSKNAKSTSKIRKILLPQAKQGPGKKKKEKKKDSTAEANRKKAIAAAASKLKLSFLAAKKNSKKKVTKKYKSPIKPKNGLQKSDKSLTENVKAQDLSVPKLIPKEGSSLAHIDIKLSAREWECVGRGEGSSTAILDSLSGNDKKSNKDYVDETLSLSDSDSVQTIEDIEYNKVSSNNESDNSDLSSGDDEDDDDQPVWLNEDINEEINDPPLRRRHASESLNIKSESSDCIRGKRVRSYSTSQVERCLPLSKNVKSSSSFSKNLRNMLVKQLLTMDKKSLQELVDDPKSRKAQFMMNHFMSMHRNALSQKLNQLRFKSSSSSASDNLDICELQYSSHLETLPLDILEQVKEILDFESNDKAQQMWEEVTLSLSDIFSALNDASKSGKEGDHDEGHKANETLASSEILSTISVSASRATERTERNLDDLDCQIVTPPPKLPTATITIPDSDNEVHSETSEQNMSGTSEGVMPENVKSLPSISPPSSTSPPESESEFLKPQDMTRPSSSMPHPERPPNPVPDCPPPDLTIEHLLSSHHTLKHSPQATVTSPPLNIQHSFLPPAPSVDPRRLKINIKNKVTEDSLLTSARNTCDINIQRPPSIKVKQERPSPLIECGLCMHPPRSPHTQHCESFAFGLPPPSPVTMMTASQRGSLRAVPPPPTPEAQRSLPHLSSSAIPSVFKQEGRTGNSFLNLEHINRPSSEERPKNPAPPDNASSEPPSPLPIPPPQSTLHPPPPPPRPLIFPTDDQFSEPPRPPSPPPPQHSPRIKLERQTPQFICCCMRNECERSNSSRQSADFRRASSTPQSQLCDSGNLRVTPHAVYKYENPYMSSLRPRTPHNGNGIVSMFPLLSPSSRCLASNGALVQGIGPGSHCLNGGSSGVGSEAPAHNLRVSVAVQTERVSRHFVPNVSFARAVTPLSSKTDQTTSTEDLNLNPNQQQPQEVSPPVEECESAITESMRRVHVNGDSSNCFVSTSSVPEDRISVAINKFSEFKPSGSLVSQLLELSSKEKEVLLCLDSVERKMKKIEEERKRLKDVLQKINDIRYERLLQRSKVLKSAANEADENRQDTSKREEVSEDGDDNVVSNSRNDESVNVGCLNSVVENQYMVSSSQELSLEFKASPQSSTEFFNMDHQSQNQNERCTSTSLPKENMYSKDSSDSDDENSRKNFCLKNQNHKLRLGKTSRFIKRNRLNSGSTSDDCQEDKVKDEEDVEKGLLNVEDSNSGNIEVGRHVSMSGCFDKEDDVADSSQIKQESEDREKVPIDLDLTEQANSLLKVDDDHICSLTSQRKGSLSASPHSPKMRNSSGSEHGYSLRSRGPPSDLFDFNSDSQLSKDTLTSGQEEQLEVSMDKQLNDEDQADDEFEKDEEIETRQHPATKMSPTDSLRKRKRKRKTKYLNKCKKKKEEETFSGSSNPKGGTAGQGSTSSNICDGCDTEDSRARLNFPPMEKKFQDPPPHMAAVVGNLIFSASTDGTARLFDPDSGMILSSYENHANSVTAIQVIGEPLFTIGSPSFFVVTGSEDGFIHVYDGKTGGMTQRKNCTEPVRCLDYKWGYLFIGTDGGSGEKVVFCGKGIVKLIAHLEGGRKVLVVGAKTTPIMIRDAMSGGLAHIPQP
ncbi:Zinc finger protein [Armadillidium vulgare]|nr:Zinc finger protein [Armadillidium vulgare]